MKKVKIEAVRDGKSYMVYFKNEDMALAHVTDCTGRCRVMVFDAPHNAISVHPDRVDGSAQYSIDFIIELPSRSELKMPDDEPTGEYEVAYIAEAPKKSTPDLTFIIERLQVCFDRFEDELFRNDIPAFIDELKAINGLPTKLSLRPWQKSDFTPIPNDMDVSLLGKNLKENDLSLDEAIEMTADQQGLSDHYEAQDLKEQAHFDKLDMHNDKKMDSGLNVNTDFFDPRDLK